MQPFKIHILGCGSALPTLKHNASAQIIEIRDKAFMVDCGEGTQVQMRRSHVHFNKISSVFISHLHGDHCFGLPGLISTFGMLGRTSPLHIYATAEYGQFLQDLLKRFCNGLDYDVVFHPIDTSKAAVVYEDKSLTVSTIPLNHRVACCGYLFREKATLPHIRRDMIDFYKIPEYERNNIKNGADWVTADGEVIPNERLTTPADRPRSYAYCSDTKYMPDLFKHVSGVDMLYHEATYCDEDIKRAALYYHSTASQAADVALKAGVGKLLLGHYSARYDNEDVLLAEAKKTFTESYLTKEMDIFDV